MALVQNTADKNVGAHQAHRQVAGQIAGEHGGGQGLGYAGILRRADGGDHALHQHDGQQDQQERRQILAQLIHDLALVTAEEEHQCKEDDHRQP